MMCALAELRLLRIQCVMIAMIPLLCLSPCLSGQERAPGHSWPEHPARLRPEIRNENSHAGWNLDAYPNLQTLDAGRTITLASIQGPAQINVIHMTQMGPVDETARSVVLEIFFDGQELPAVSVPIGDFFADGTGLAANFSTPFVEKTPDAYNCYVPMPFKKSARVTLRNDSSADILNYSYVEWQSLPDWDESLGYFHASRQRIPFQLTLDTAKTFYRLTGPGHLVGEYWNINTDERIFRGFTFVMEGNAKHRVDGEKEPSINYLGSEDSFNFSWGWHKIFTGYKVGINYLAGFDFDGHRNSDLGKQNRLSSYRFRDWDVIHFRKSLELTVDWTGEVHAGPKLITRMQDRARQGGGWVDYAVTAYWYSADPAGLRVKLPPVSERIKPLLRENPPQTSK